MNKLVFSALSTIIGLVPVDVARQMLDDLIDIPENWATANPDDPRAAAVTSACKVLRDILNLPDDIGGDED